VIRVGRVSGECRAEGGERDEGFRLVIRVGRFQVSAELKEVSVMRGFDW